tara:strand:- start:288 stop:485 length:198 start_codon:yes stop_codon:yes gene_type:complete
MNLNALDLIALELYKDGIREAKEKYVTLHESNYKEIAKYAYEQAKYFLEYSNKRKFIPQDIENIA